MFTFFLSSRSLSFFFLLSSWVASVAVVTAAAAAAAAAVVAAVVVAAAVAAMAAAVVPSLSLPSSASPLARLAPTLPSIWGLGLCMVLLFGFVSLPLIRSFDCLSLLV